MKRLTAIILTKNSEQTLQNCLDSVQFADEVLVIDDFSEDETVNIAKKNGARVVQNHLADDFAQQRNFAQTQTDSEWLLHIDSDEVVPEALAQEIKNFINKPTSRAASLCRQDIFLGKKLAYGEVEQAYKKGFIRLIQAHSGVWKGKVHEKFMIDTSFKFSQPLIHYPHQNIKEFIQHVDIYSSLRAKELYIQHQPFSLFQMIFFPFGKFFWTFIMKKGFLDGPSGFVYSFMMSFHSFLVRAKLLQMYTFHD